MGIAGCIVFECLPEWWQLTTAYKAFQNHAWTAVGRRQWANFVATAKSFEKKHCGGVVGSDLLAARHAEATEPNGEEQGAYAQKYEKQGI